MRLNSITAKNYRTLKDIKLAFFTGYCTISGKNNAGKSCVIRLLTNLFRTGTPTPWLISESKLDYKDDKTQWVKQASAIRIDYELELTKDDDPALISFIEKIAQRKTQQSVVALHVSYTVADSGDPVVGVFLDGQSVDEQAAKEIEKRIKDSNLLFLYNSTTRHEDYYFGGGRRRMLYEFAMSEEEKKGLIEAGKRTERKLKQLAKEHTQGLATMLGRLSEKYDVELSPPESFAARRMPLGINLKDRSVEVPIDDWGSGTQNRTHILMAILQANRIKTTASPDDKITPIVVIEEPESFLHPSAQAEFGRILGILSAELEIQIIVTTHSPYMLNQAEPTSNILLSRKVKRKTPLDTFVVETSANNWMAPFSEHLGLPRPSSAAFGHYFPRTDPKFCLLRDPSTKSISISFRNLETRVRGSRRTSRWCRMEARTRSRTLYLFNSCLGNSIGFLSLMTSTPKEK